MSHPKRSLQIGDNPPLKTRTEVQTDFHQRGASVRAWAIKNKCDPLIAAHVVSGRLKGLRGEAHKVAVLLGMKVGIVEGAKK